MINHLSYFAGGKVAQQNSMLDIWHGSEVLSWNFLLPLSIIAACLFLISHSLAIIHTSLTRENPHTYPYILIYMLFFSYIQKKYHEMGSSLLDFSLIIKGVCLKGLIDTLGNIRLQFLFQRTWSEESSKNLNTACPKESATTYCVYHKV